ncbi:hypothetical protein GW796_00500 [archaeon]|nr:hypothetical protein [archaeon]
MYRASNVNVILSSSIISLTSLPFTENEIIFFHPSSIISTIEIFFFNNSALEKYFKNINTQLLAIFHIIILIESVIGVSLDLYWFSIKSTQPDTLSALHCHPSKY